MPIMAAIDPTWALVAVTIIGMLGTAFFNAYLMGKKTEELRSDIRNLATEFKGHVLLQQEKDETCEKDRIAHWKRTARQDSHILKHSEEIQSIKHRIPNPGHGS